MNYLLLPRIVGDKKSLKYVKNKIDVINISDHYGGIYRALRKKNRNIFIIVGDVFFISYRAELRSNFFIKLIIKIIRNLPILKNLDRFFYSIFIGVYCRLFKIKLVYCELEYKFCPKWSRYISPNTIFTEWFGVFPFFLENKIVKNVHHFDYIWSPGEYKKHVSIPSREKWVDVGNVVDPCLFNRKQREKKIDILFFGGITKKHSDRIEILELVANNFKNFKFYGYGIENLSLESPLKKNFKGWISAAKLPDLIAESKIVLNLTLNNYEVLNTGFNARLLEIAAVGTSVQVVKHDIKIYQFLSADSVVTFKGKNDLIKTLKFVLINFKSYQSKILNAKKESKKYNYERLIDLIEMKTGIS